MDHLITLLLEENLEIAFITETWFQTQQNYSTATLKENGYFIFHFNRENKGGGGVAIIYRDYLKLCNTKRYKFETYECILGSIASISSSNINFVVIYRHCEFHPSLFLEEFQDFLERIVMQTGKIIILGDFNLHVNKVFNPEIIHFNSILSSFGLSQLIDQPTHIAGNTLDLVITNKTETQIKDINIDHVNFSDHSFVFFKVPFEFKISNKKMVSIKIYKEINSEKFNIDIDSKVKIFSEQDYDNFSEALNCYNMLCNEAVKDYVEYKTVNISKARPKWMDTEYVKSRATRRRLYKRWVRTRSTIDRCNFVTARECTHQLSIEKQTNFYRKTIENSNNSQKSLFSICKNLLDMSKSRSLPSHSCSIDLANKFNDYFINKIEKIRKSFDTEFAQTKRKSKDAYKGNVMSDFNPVSSDWLKKMMLNKTIKASPDDPLPGFLFKQSLDQLLPAITLLVNLSLSTGSMEGLKDSVITPILKKAGSDPEVLKNYRPVCNTLYLSKTIERVVISQANNHMDSNNAHTPNQSGYKPFHSCETLLLRVTNDILNNLDNSKCTIAILLDLSAAFDTVDHDLLLEILWFDLGFRGTVYKWFKDFLFGRKQAVCINGEKSEFRENKFGVPQGSVVGPFLFNVYVRSLMKLMEDEGFMAHGYADDHQFLFTFQIDFQASVIRWKIPGSLDIISKWMKRYFLRLNTSKTQVIVFHPDSKLCKVVFSQLILSDGSHIQLSDSVYNLGVTLDAQMSFSPHVSSIISQGYRLIRNISGIRKFVSRDHLKTLVNSIIIAKFDNCNSLLFGISAFDTGRLRRLQNSCARLIYNVRKRDHVSYILQELHWLPCEARICFKILCYVFKCIHDLAPIYLSELLVSRQSHDLSLQIPKTLSNYGDRSFSCAAPRLWNALPVEIRLATSLEVFKSKLKHYFFGSFIHFKERLNKYKV